MSKIEEEIDELIELREARIHELETRGLIKLAEIGTQTKVGSMFIQSVIVEYELIVKELKLHKELLQQLLLLKGTANEN